MRQIYLEKTVNYNLNLVYRVVNDIESYPIFLPWCKELIIVRSVPEEHLRIAHAIMGIRMFQTKYLCSIISTLNDTTGVIDVKSIEGPFKFLKSKWEISSLDLNNTHVKFNIQFVLNSIILEKLAKVWIEYAKTHIMRSFEQRCHALSRLSITQC